MPGLGLSGEDGIMARRAIIIGPIDHTSGRPKAVNVALWAAVPAGRESIYAKPTASSSVPDATEVEIQAIRDGAIAETTIVIRIDQKMTRADVRTAVISAFTAWQDEITTFNPNQNLSESWDGTAWT